MAYGATVTLPTFTGTLPNFPVLIPTVAWPTAAVNGGPASVPNGGGPLRAYDSPSKAIQYPLEVVKFVTGVTPVIQVRVIIPSASSGETFYVESDDTETSQPFESSTYGRDNVWTNDIAVWHCEESSGNLVDSTGNGHAAVPQNSPSYGATGQIGNAVSVANSGSKHFQVANSSDFDFSSLSAGYRFRGWFDLDASQASWVGLYAKGDTGNDFGAQRNSSTGDLRINHGSANVTITDGFSDITGVGRVKVDICWNKSNILFYVNGSLVASPAFTDAPIYNDTYPLKLGAERAGGTATGDMDEFGFSKDFVPSADWIAAEYANETDAGGWVTMGDWIDNSAAAELAGDASAQTSATGSLTTEIPLTGASIVVATAGGSLNVPISLAGNAAVSSAATASLTTQIPLAGDASGNSAASGDLSSGVSLSADAASESTATADLTATITLSGQAVAQALAAAGIDTTILLSGDASSQSTSTGELAGGAAQLYGDASATATATGSLTAQIVLSGAAVVQALATGSLDNPVNLAGSASGESGASGELSTAINLAGAAVATVTGQGDLNTQIKLDGAAVGASSATGDLVVSLSLSGNAAAVVLAGGDLTTQIPLSGSAISAALGSGSLTVSGVTVRAPDGQGYSPGRVISVRPAQKYPIRIH